MLRNIYILCEFAPKDLLYLGHFISVIGGFRPAYFHKGFGVSLGPTVIIFP